LRSNSDASPTRGSAAAIVAAAITAAERRDRLVLPILFIACDGTCKLSSGGHARGRSVVILREDGFECCSDVASSRSKPSDRRREPPVSAV